MTSVSDVDYLSQGKIEKFPVIYISGLPQMEMLLSRKKNEHILKYPSSNTTMYKSLNYIFSFVS